MSRWIAVMLMVVGCTSTDKPAPHTDTTDTDTDTDTTGPTDTDSDSDSDTDTDVGTLPWERMNPDCDNITPFPAPFTVHNFVDPHEDYTFSADGYLIGVFGSALQRMPFGGPREVLVPGMNDVRGTRFLADGRLVLADSSSQALRLLDPTTGASEVIAGGLTNPNGIAIGYDGWVYVTVQNQVLRVHPDTLEREVFVDLPGNSFDGITFSPDFKFLYFNEEFGAVHRVEIDEDGYAIGTGIEIPMPVGMMSILDGMTADACGNLYVIEMTGKVFQVTPDGDIEVAVNLAGTGAFIPSLNFGPGEGGYEKNTLYIMDFMGRLFEVPMGVPGKWEPHLPVP